MVNFQNLYEFIDRAVKNRKYPANTALGLKAALKLFESEVNEEEKNSVKKFEENLDQIYHAVSSKNKDITASSLATYKSRVLKVLRDYNTYGADPTKMNGWIIKPLVRQKKQESSQGKAASLKTEESSEVLPVSDFIGMHKIELALRPDKKFIIIVPMDISQSESATIKAVLDSLVVKTVGDKSKD